MVFFRKRNSVEEHFKLPLLPKTVETIMADVDSSVVYTTTERKTRKVKKTTKRRESHDQNAEVTITEVDNTTTNNHSNAIDEYVLAGG